MKIQIFDDSGWQDGRGDRGIPASGYKFWKRTECYSGGAPQDEDGHQGSSGQSSYSERGTEPITFQLKPCFVI